MAIFDLSNTRSRVTFICGAAIAVAKHHDIWTSQECLYAIGALLFGLIIFSATGAIFFYWAIGNFKGVVAVMKRNADDPRAQWLGCGAIGFGGNRNEQKIKAVAEPFGATRSRRLPPPTLLPHPPAVLTPATRSLPTPTEKTTEDSMTQESKMIF